MALTAARRNMGARTGRWLHGADDDGREREADDCHGASSSSKCPQVDEYVDTLNRSTTAAKIVGVACLDNSTYSFVLREQDARIMEWKQAEGRDELAPRMALGR